jgi:hypothetical protein
MAQSAWILRFFFAALAALAPAAALASATAQGVALNAAAGCSTSDLDITLTTVGATTELWQATTLSGAIGGGTKATPLANFSGTATSVIPLSPQPPPNTLIGAYTYVGATPPAANTTAEFFVYYNCSTRQVLLACFGPYGTCPQTAAQAAVLLASRVPTLSEGAGILVLRRWRA